MELLANLKHVVPALRTALSRPDSLMRAIAEYADRIHPYRDGKSSERVLSAAERAIELGRAGLKGKRNPRGQQLRGRLRRFNPFAQNSNWLRIGFRQGGGGASREIE